MVVWGATPIATRLALDDLPPLVLACLRTILAGLVAIPLLVGMRQRLPVQRRSRTLLGISAGVGFVIFPVVYTVGQQRTSALHGVMILAALPIFTGGYAAVVARSAPRRAWLAGCAVALVGEVVLIGGRNPAATDATLAGDLLVLAAALCVSAGYVAGAMLPPLGLSSLATTLWGVLLGTAVLAPLAVGLLAGGGAPEAGATAWGAVIFLAVVTSILGYVRLVLGARSRWHSAHRDTAVSAARVRVHARRDRPRRARHDADRTGERARRHRDRGRATGLSPWRPEYAGRMMVIPDRVLVVGLVRSGRAAVAALRAGGGTAVVAYDADAGVDVAGIDGEVELGEWDGATLDGVSLVVKSPGVPDASEPITAARNRGIAVISEIELGARLLANPILGVTGTNGKTTTTALLGAMFAAAGMPAEVAGNIGRPLTSLVGVASPAAWVV
jgi:drug/metabolite transporter (DMT)-like permease